MRIHDLDVLGSAVGPYEANAPLVADADAVLFRPIALRWFQAVARRCSQIAQGLGVVQLPQPALGNTLSVRSDPSGKAITEQRLGVRVSERTDHRMCICTRRVMNVKRSYREAAALA